MSKKISNFLSDSIALSDEITFVRSGTNFKTTVSDLIQLFGAIGTITSEGEPAAVPVLEQPTASENKIRKILAGSGILPSISPLNGIQLDLNAVNGTPGSKILVSPSAAQSVFRSLVAGTGINIAEAGNTIQISAVDATVSSKTVIVSEESDFPAPVGGVITLEDDKDYLIVQDITTSNRFLSVGNNTVRAASSQLITLTYSGSDVMFTGVNSNVKLDGITISAPLGTLFDFSNDAPTGIFQFIEGNVEECDSIGTFNNMFIVRFDAMGWEDIKTSGMLFTGIIFNADLSTGVVFLNGGTFIDLGTALFNELSISKQVLQLTSDPSATFLSGQAASANILSGGIASCADNRVSVLTTPLSGVSESDNRFEFNFNTGIPDSINDGLMYVEGSTTETVISSSGVKVKVTNVWTSGALSRFSFDSNGRLTYTGERNARLPIDITTTLLTASGGDKQCELCLAINGAVVSQTCKQSTLNSSKAASVTTLWQHEFKTGDYVEVFVSNEDDTTNIVVQQAIMRIN